LLPRESGYKEYSYVSFQVLKELFSPYTYSPTKDSSGMCSKEGASKQRLSGPAKSYLSFFSHEQIEKDIAEEAIESTAVE